MELLLDFRKYKMRELRLFREKTGRSLLDIKRGFEPEEVDYQAFIWISGMRENPDFTWDEAGEVTFEQFVQDMGDAAEGLGLGVDDNPPTEASTETTESSGAGSPPSAPDSHGARRRRSGT